MGTDVCVGCLGSEQCWVCLGRGQVELRPAQMTACVRCSGTGKCFVCQPIPRALPLAKPQRRWTRRPRDNDSQAAS